MQAFNESLDFLGIFAFQIQSQRKVVVGFVHLSQLLVYLTQQHWNWRLLGHQTLQRLQLLNCLIVPLQLDKCVGFLIFVQSVLVV